jgi:ABC-type sugar transport system permease subunit
MHQPNVVLILVDVWHWVPLIFLILFAAVQRLPTGGCPGTSSELLSLHLYEVFFEQNQLGYGALLSAFTIAGVLSLLVLARWLIQRWALR